MKIKIAPFLLAIVCVFSSLSFANRCEWNRTFNRVHCCKANEQALWNEIYKRVECVESESGDSCVWDNRFNRIRCCDTKDHGVWNPQFNRVSCHQLEDDAQK